MQEIERKFLVKHEKWTPANSGIKIEQGYLSDEPERSIRVRIAENKAYLTVKGKPEGIKRKEVEFGISLKDARALMEMAVHTPVKKTRYIEKTDNFNWEVDVFEGENSGLILAEIELENEEQNFEKPDWVDKEVSGDKRYYNLSLSKNPYSNWKS